MLQIKPSPKRNNNNTDDNFESHTALKSSVHHNTERDQNKCSCASGREQRLVKTGLKPWAQCGALAFATSPAHMRTLHNADIPACCLLQTHVQTVTSYDQQTECFWVFLHRLRISSLFIPRSCCNAAEMPGALKILLEKENTFSRLRKLTCAVWKLEIKAEPLQLPSSQVLTVEWSGTWRLKNQSIPKNMTN